MTLKHVSLTMRADTTAADIQDFLDRASKYAPSVTSGLRARRDVEKTGGSEAEVVVLYVRTDRKAEALGDKILLLLDDVCAYFTARAEHSLAAQTLLERANIIKPIDETPGQTALYTHIDKVLNEEYRCLTAATASDVWGQAFPAYDPRGFWKELTGKLSLMYQTTRETRENIDALKDKISYLLFNQQRGVGGSARRSLDRILPGAIQQRTSLRYLRALYDLLLPLQSRDGKPEFIAYSEDCMDGFSDLRTFCAVYKKAFDDERPQPASQNDVAALAPELLDEREFKALNLIVRFVMDINDRCPASRTASHGSDESLQPASEPDLPDKTKESEIVPVTKPCGEVQRETLEVEKQGTLRQYVDARAGIPKNDGQKNGQTPRQIIDEGMKQLSYFESMLAGPDESVGHTEKTHLAKFFSFLGYEREDSASLVMQFEGFTAIHKMICLPNDPGATPAQISETEWRWAIDIDEAISFSKLWLSRWKSHRKQHDQFNYNHIRAIDYLAGSILRVYRPQGVEMADVEALQSAVASRPKHIYTSISQSMNPRFKKWIDDGESALLFSSSGEPDMQWQFKEVAEDTESLWAKGSVGV